MKKLSRLGAVALASLLVLSGGQVFADESQEPTEDPGDTTFNLAYDPAHQVLLWNLAMSDGPYDCSLNQAGSLRATYGVSLDGVVPVTDLRSVEGDDPVMFPNRPEEEVGEDFEPASDPVEYAEDGLCGLVAAEVAGPQGQVNHGSFMSLFNSLWEGPGRGCVNRYLAQSEFGKGDQQVQVNGDEEPATEVTGLVPDDTGIDFFTFAADCERGNGNGNGNGNGQDKDKGKPESPGNSANAPGKNK